MSLENMFELQRKFQSKLKNDIDSKEYKKEMALALMIEIGEFMNTVDWKSWKHNHIENEDKIKEELIDVWHFLINITLPWMSVNELYKRFNKKHNINNERQKNDY